MNQRALRAQSSLSFCYLCGQSFDIAPSDMSEHVVSRGVLGPSTDRTWPVILPAHRKCDSTLKMPHDNEMALWHRVMIQGLQSVSESDQKAFFRACEEITFPDGRRRFVSRRIGELRRAAWNWVRGMHAVLYHEFLPADLKRDILAPVPSYRSHDKSSAGEAPDIQQSLEESEHVSQSILEPLDRCLANNTFDGIWFWDRKAGYVSTWFPPRDNTTDAVCLWALTSDRIFGIVRDSDWMNAPWHGWYASPRVPDGASIVGK